MENKKIIFALSSLLALLIIYFSINAVLLAQKGDPIPSEDLTPPVISSVSVDEITTNTALVTWLTNEPADSQVDYGLSEDGGSTSPLDETLVEEHSVLLTDLEPETNYYLTVRSKDAANNSSVSNVVSFLTAPDVSGPTFSMSDLTVSVTTSSATIEWQTNELATSHVDYGLSSIYGQRVDGDDFVTSHQLVLSDLTPNTTYHFSTLSINESGSELYSIDSTFQTAIDNRDTTAPFAITDLSARLDGGTSVILTWTAPTDKSGVISYDINGSDKPLTEENFFDAQVIHEADILLDEIESQGVEHSYQLVGLSPGSTLYLAIKASDPYGNSSPISNVVEVTLPVEQKQSKSSAIGSSGSVAIKDSNKIAVNVAKNPPDAVNNVRAVGLDKLISISWQNPKGDGFSRTRIVRDQSAYPTDPHSGTLVYDGKGTIFSDPGLINAKTYYYSLFSYDNNSVYSPATSFSLAPYAERRHYHVLYVGERVIDLSPVERDLKLGDTGDDVGHVQELLAMDPTLYPEGLVTGYFGTLTEAAVRRLQQKFNLPVTGLVDAHVRALGKNVTVPQLLSEQPITGIIGALYQDMGLGAEGEEVKTLQLYLQEQGFLESNLVTGYFSPQTQQAVLEFQKAHDISPQTGYVGPKTRAKILELLQITPTL